MYETRNVRSDLAHHEKDQEGIIVWDHKGVVILWPEGHSSRFAWSTLRALCTCADCQRKTVRAAPAERYAA